MFPGSFDKTNLTKLGLHFPVLKVAEAQVTSGPLNELQLSSSAQPRHAVAEPARKTESHDTLLTVLLMLVLCNIEVFLYVPVLKRGEIKVTKEQLRENGTT